MDAVEEYIFRLEGNQRSTGEFLHKLLLTYPGIHTKISYSLPFYLLNKRICYLNPKKQGGVELVFIRGQELSNTQGLLEARDRKQMAGIIFKRPSEIQQQAIHEIIMEAIILDEQVSNSSRKKRFKT